MPTPEEREEYRQRRAEEVRLEQKVLDAVAEAVSGSKWEVPNAVMTNVLVVMTSVDDDKDHCTTWLTAGSWTEAEGMARRVIRDVEWRDHLRRTSLDDYDDDA